MLLNLLNCYFYLCTTAKETGGWRKLYNKLHNFLVFG
jgi:hypothetical protein